MYRNNFILILANLLLFIAGSSFSQSVEELKVKKAEFVRLELMHERLSRKYADSIEQIEYDINIALFEKSNSYEINEQIKLGKYANVKFSPDLEAEPYYDARGKNVLITKLVTHDFVEIVYKDQIYYTSIASVISNNKVKFVLALMKQKEEDAEQAIEDKKKKQRAIEIEEKRLTEHREKELKQQKSDSLRAEQERINEANRIKRKAKKKTRLIAKYGEYDGLRLFLGDVWIGMTEEMLLDSRGYPKDINTTETSYGVNKQYVYGAGFYVYVKDGIVTSLSVLSPLFDI